MSRKILLIDDEPNVTRGMKHTLRKEDYEILSATSSKEALDILEQTAVDVVVSDEQMPGMSGTEFLVLVKQRYPEIIRILLTGHASSEAVLRAVNEAHIYRFLLKPCNGLDLLITIRRACQQKDILNKAHQLLNISLSKSNILESIEKEQPGIIRRFQEANMDVETVSHIKDIDNLIEMIDAELKNSSDFLPDTPQIDSDKTQDKSVETQHSESQSQSVNEVADRETEKTTVSQAQDKEKLEHQVTKEPEKTNAGEMSNSEIESAVSLSLEGVETINDLKPIMTRSEIKEYLDNCEELKALSPTVAQVLKMTQSSRCSIEQVTKVIKQDHAISLKILKLANSTAYTRGEPVDTIQKAVTRIGLSQIRQTVLNISIVDKFSNNEQTELISTPYFWEHSIATGLIAVEITHGLGGSNPQIESAFTMGLLHDIGRMAYLEMLGDKYVHVLEAAQALQVPLEQVESRMLLINHADAMDRILHKWKFPKELINPIAMHQLSLGNIRRMTPRTLTETATLALANRLAHALLLGSSGNLTLYPTEEFCHTLKLKPELIRNIKEEIPDQTDDVKISILASSNQQAWSRLRDKLAEQLNFRLHPIVISAEPEFDSACIFCEQIHEISEDEQPNVGVIHIKRGQERVPLTRALAKAEAEAGVEMLPLVILSPKGDIQLEERAMADRQFELLPFPVSISRVIEAFNKLKIPCTAESVV